MCAIKPQRKWKHIHTGGFRPLLEVTGFKCWCRCLNPGSDRNTCAFLYCRPANEQDPTPPDRGLLHIWQSAGASEQLCPERVLLSRPVLQATLGEHHGLLLIQGECVFIVKTLLTVTMIFTPYVLPHLNWEGQLFLFVFNGENQIAALELLNNTHLQQEQKHNNDKVSNLSQVVRCIPLGSYYGEIWASLPLHRCWRSLSWGRPWSAWQPAASTVEHWASRAASTCGGRTQQDSVGWRTGAQSRTSQVKPVHRNIGLKASKAGFFAVKTTTLQSIFRPYMCMCVVPCVSFWAVPGQCCGQWGRSASSGPDCGSGLWTGAQSGSVIPEWAVGLGQWLPARPGHKQFPSV